MEDQEKTKDEQLADMQAQLERLRMEVEGAQNATLAVSAERDSLRGQLAGAAPAASATSAPASSPASASTFGAAMAGGAI